MSASSPVREWYAKNDDGETYSPNLEETDRVHYITRQIESGERAKASLLQQGWEGMAFYCDRQWATFNRVQGTVSEPPAEDYEIRQTLNYISPCVDTAAAKLTQHSPGWVVAPATSDEDDQEAARASEKLLEHLWHELRMGSKATEYVVWSLVTGLGIIRCYWDDTLGDELEDGTRSGAPCVDVCSVFSTTFDPGCAKKDLSDCRWVSETMYLHIDEVRTKWDKGRFVSADTAYENDNYAASLLADFRSDSGNKSDLVTDRVKVQAYYERRSPRYPDGYYAVTAGGILLEENDLPDGELPFVTNRFNAVPGKLAGRGMVSRLMPVQEMINRQISARLEVVALHSGPKWAVERGSVDRTQFTSQPNEIIEYARGSRPPMPIPPPPLSPEHERLEQAGINHIRQISGVNEISQGVVPASISGRAAQWMAELDASKLAPASKELEEAFGFLGSRLLRLWRDNMKAEQTIKVLGKNNRMEVLAFHSSSIRSTDVRVLSGSMQVRHPSVKRETVMMGFERGMYGNPSDPEAVQAARKDMEWGDLEFLNGDQAGGESNYAREENGVFASGDTTPKVAPWESHQAHKKEHKAFLASVAFREIASSTPGLYEAVVRHLAEHEYWLEREAQKIPWWTDITGPVQPAGAPGAPGPGGPGPGGQQVPRHDGFGVEPGTQDVPPQQGMTPQQVEAMAAAATQQQGLRQGPPMNAGYLPPTVPQGAGVGEFDMSRLTE